MARPVGHIRILLSSRVLFDLEEADQIFAEKGPAEYEDYMRARGNYEKDFNAEYGGRVLKPGALWHLAETITKLNELHPGAVELGVVCKDNAVSALPIFRNIDKNGLHIEMRMVTFGRPLQPEDHLSFGTDLFLSRNAADVQTAIDLGVASAMVNYNSGTAYSHGDKKALKLWFDGDAVAFGSSAELLYRKEGLENYHKNEFNFFAKEIERGPFTDLLVKLTEFNRQFDKDNAPFELALLTARGHTGCARALTIADKYGIEFNGGMYFMGGASKGTVLQRHLPDLFFDDQQVHLKEASAYCATGHVAYKSESEIFKYLAEQAAKNTQAPKPPQP